MICFISNCGARLSAGMVVVEVGGMYCCPSHIHEIRLNHLGKPPARPEPIYVGRPRPPIDDVC